MPVEQRCSTLTLCLYASFCALILLAACSGARTGVGANASVVADTTDRGKLPPGRAGLAVPDSIWDAAMHDLGPASGVLGYTADQMAFYNPDAYVLRTVWGLFRNARTIPRYSGQVAQGLLDNAAAPEQVVQRCFALTDVSAGRFFPPFSDSVENTRWYGASNIELPGAYDSLLAWTDRTRSVMDPLIPTSAMDTAKSGEVPPPSDDRSAWKQLPAHVKQLVARLVVGIAEGREWLRGAYGAIAAFDVYPAFAISSAPYAYAAGPWLDEREGQSATTHPETFRLLDAIDRRQLAFASVVVTAHVNRALQEFRRADSAHPVRLERMPSAVFYCLAGTVVVKGTGDDMTEDVGAMLVIDLGGNDRYVGRCGASSGKLGDISIVLDCGGDDTYDDGGRSASLACGLFGIGGLFDLAGNDSYRCRESGLGCGWYGTGMLMDFAGNDRYTVDSMWGQGAAHVGMGALIDLAGDDRYVCGSQSQAMGGTLGAGVLVDVAGNDHYEARDDGAISPLYLGQSVSMSQGVGYGRRADLGDGHSLGGGVGVLVDGSGDDSYSAPVWSQGAGYWWGLGILEDFAGDDTYRSGKYSIGAAAHFAIGCKVDLAGNDRYAVGYDAAVNQYLGHARDGSIGLAIDGDGDDRYYLKSHTAGSADLGSIGLLWDRRGDDLYEANFQVSGEQAGWSDTPPFGTATSYPAGFNSFRDDVFTWGLFLDTGGNDRYTWDSRGTTWPADSGKPGNGGEWWHRRARTSIGTGLDVNWYR